LAGAPEAEEKWDFPEPESFENDFAAEPVVNKPEPGPAVVIPTAELFDSPEPQVQQAKPAPQPAASRRASDEQYFDELFDEKPKPRQEQPEPDIFQETNFPEPIVEPFFGETVSAAVPAVTAESSVGRREPKRQSDLPGESADDFLFGPGERNDVAYSRSRVEKSRVDDSLFDDDDDEYEDEPPRRRKKSGGSGGGFAKTASVAGNILFVVLLLFMATLSFFLIQSRISGGVPKVAGYQMYIVLSGSMSPEFDTGSLAFVKETPTEQLVVGDIITFRSQSGSDSLTTHRIVEVNRDEGLRFVTRGDANNVNDPNMVLAENVVGRVTGSIPYVGYVMSFVQTRQGLILLIFVPGVLIILFELGKIMKYLTQDEGGGRKSKKRKKYPRLAED
jgi:signal peptidase I